MFVGFVTNIRYATNYDNICCIAININYRANCGVRITVGKDDLKVRKQTGPAEHRHMSDKNTIMSKKVEVEKLQAAMIHPNQSTSKTLTTGIATELQNQELLPYASSPKAIEMRLKRAKQKEKLYPKLPSTIEEMIAVFPESLKVTQISCVIWMYLYIYMGCFFFTGLPQK